jgi:predicted Fe-Mo cluster-binding NifX family protein
LPYAPTFNVHFDEGDHMKIAVASDDGRSIAAHFGRCAGFLIFDVADRKATQVEHRSNAGGQHNTGEDCTHGHHDHHHAVHSHESFTQLLADCQVIICRGMGRRAVADLEAGGIAPFIIAEEVSAHEAADRYADGRLKGSNISTCCSH